MSRAIVWPNRKARCSSGPRYQEIDDRRTQVSGAQRIPASRPTVKLEGSVQVGERAVLLCGSCDQQVIARIRDILAEVTEVVRGLVCRDEPEDYRLILRVYGTDGGVRLAGAAEPDAARDLQSSANASR